MPVPQSRSPLSKLLFLPLVTLAACGGGGTTEPSVPTQIAVAPASLAFSAVGESQQLTARVTDQRGDAVPDASVTWSSDNPDIVTVSPTGLATAVGGGTAAVSASSGGLETELPVSVVQSVASFEAVSGNAQPGLAGEDLALPLVVRATDALGNPVAGATVRFSVTRGGGTVLPADATTRPDGTASSVFRVGGPGTPQEVTVTSSGSTATVTFTATVTATPATVTRFSGSAQTALPGTPVPIPPSARVVDGAGEPVPGVAVQFAVGQGGGSVSGAPGPVVITNANGVATLGGWVLGAAGVNTLEASLPGQILAGDPAVFVATVRPPTGFDITIQYLGEATSSQLLAFAEAEIRWESLVVGDVPDLPVNARAGDCGLDSPALSRTVDDLHIFASLEPIDGPGSILGSAGPCFIRVPGDLPVVGAMRFDTDDLELIEESGLLSSVILHEMGHVLGIGSLWLQQELLQDPSLAGGTDPHFNGPQATTAFDAAGGASYDGAKVPVESTGGAGTADKHWRESVLDAELMTGFVAVSGNPLSAITVSSLADQGYTVDLSKADPFSLNTALRIAGSGDGVALGDDLRRGPIHRVDASGRVVDTVHPR